MKNQKTKHKIPNTKNNKGITLVALIITIIVLLILAIVAIRAVTDGGIIQKAQSASDKQAIAQEKEEIGLAQNEWGIQKFYPNNGFLEFMRSALGENAKEVTGDNTQVTVTMKSGRTYTVTDAGEIVTGWYDNGDGSYTKGEETVKLGETTYTNAQVLEKLGIAQSEYTGTYGSKDEETWTVIGVEGDKIKLVSTKNVANNVALGYNDLGAKVEIPAADESAPTDAEKFKRSLWSYNNALETLQAAVETGTKGIPGARSITIEDIETILNITEEKKRASAEDHYGRTYRFYYEGDVETGKVYVSYLDWNETDTEAEDTKEEGWSIEYGGNLNKFISYDNKVIDGTDANKNNVVKIKENYYSGRSLVDGFLTPKFRNSLAVGDYWLASKWVQCSLYGSAGYIVLRLYDGGSVNNNFLCSSGGDAYKDSNGVRAVIYI